MAPLVPLERRTHWRSPVFAAFVLMAAAIAGVRHAWLCDDAFICFRYARNWVEGFGLVFNAGERVEGYTNPLWTASIALGMKLGVIPERWTTLWGIASYLGTVAVLWGLHREVRRRAGGVGIEGPSLPAGALAAAFHTELAIYATSGLETSTFTFFSVAGLALVAWPGTARRAFAAGVVLGLASITRHDGVLFAAVGGIAVATVHPRHALAFAAGFALLVVPVSLARVAYYGTLLPNTYHAKSGNLSWYTQGLRYLGLYLRRSWVVMAGLVGWGALAFHRSVRVSPLRDAVVRPGGVLAAGALVYTCYVTRVGGDFMFARMLIPATPPLLALLDFAQCHPALRAPSRSAALTVAAVAGLLLTPSPFGRGEDGHPELLDGITDEHAYYAPEEVELEEQRAAAVAPLFAGLPVRLAFYGGEARFVYRTRVAVAIEGHTGLTDAVVAHQALNDRGRVGHEKLAPASYLIDVRRVHLTFSKVPTERLGLDHIIPRVRGDFGGVGGRLLTWDPELIAALRRRGANIPDFPRMLDGYMAQVLPSLPVDEAQANYTMAQRFYFATTPDTEREQAFRRLIQLAPAAVPTAR